MARGVNEKHHFIRWSEPPERMGLFIEKKKKAGGMSDWDKIRAKLATQPGKWALIRVADKRPVYTAAQRDGLEIVTREFIHRRTKKYGTWARIPAKQTVETIGNDVIVKDQFTDLTNTD